MSHHKPSRDCCLPQLNANNKCVRMNRITQTKYYMCCVVIVQKLGEHARVRVAREAPASRPQFVVWGCRGSFRSCCMRVTVGVVSLGPNK